MFFAGLPKLSRKSNQKIKERSAYTVFIILSSNYRFFNASVINRNYYIELINNTMLKIHNT